MGFSLTVVQDSMANELDYIDLGLSCAEVCDALGQGLKGKRLDELDQPVLGAIGKLTTYVGVSMRVLGGVLTNVAIAGLWPRWRGRSSRWVNGELSLDFCVRRTIRRLSRVGGRTSTEFFTSST